MQDTLCITLEGHILLLSGISKIAIFETAVGYLYVARFVICRLLRWGVNS